MNDPVKTCIYLGSILVLTVIFRLAKWLISRLAQPGTLSPEEKGTADKLSPAERRKIKMNTYYPCKGCTVKSVDSRCICAGYLDYISAGGKRAARCSRGMKQSALDSIKIQAERGLNFWKNSL